MKSTITFIPLGGLANRFYAITSAIAFCQDHNVKLRIIWFKDWGMGAGFNSILELYQHYSDVDIRDAKWRDYIFDRPRKRNLWIPYLFQKALFDERIYEKDVYEGSFSLSRLKMAISKYESIYLVQCNCFYSKTGMFQLLCPTLSIQRSIDNRKNMLDIDKNMIGVHIRRTDHVHSIKNSPLSLFVAKMNEEILENPLTRFYVASDDYKEKYKLKEIFGDRIVMALDEVRRDNLQGISDAVVELYILASMKKIYGSSNSTYSRLAAQLFNIKLEILSIE